MKNSWQITTLLLAVALVVLSIKMVMTENKEVAPKEIVSQVATKNETLEFIKSRRTCRSYTNEQITDEQLNAILEAGMHAPSGMGRQAPIFIAIQDPEVIAELSKINTALWGKGKDALHGAPTVIVVLDNPTISPTTFRLDAMAAVQNMLIAAESMDLGAACISRAKEEFESDYGKALLEKLGVPEGYVGVEHVIVGHRNGEKRPTPARREGRIFKL